MVGVDCTLPVRQYSPNSKEGATSASEQAARSGEAFRQSLTLWDLEGESKVEPPDQQRRSFAAEQLDETFVKFQEEVPGVDPQVAQAHVGFPALQRRRAVEVKSQLALAGAVRQEVQATTQVVESCLDVGQVLRWADVDVREEHEVKEGMLPNPPRQEAPGPVPGRGGLAAPGPEQGRGGRSQEPCGHSRHGPCLGRSKAEAMGAPPEAEQAARSGAAFRQRLILRDLEVKSKVVSPDQQCRLVAAEQLDRVFDVKFQEEVSAVARQAVQEHVGSPDLQVRHAVEVESQLALAGAVRQEVAQDASSLQVGLVLLAEKVVACTAGLSSGLAIRAQSTSPEAEQAAYSPFALHPSAAPGLELAATDVVEVKGLAVAVPSQDGQAELVAQDASCLQVGLVLLAEEVVACTAGFSSGLAIRAQSTSPEAEQAACSPPAMLPSAAPVLVLAATAVVEVTGLAVAAPLQDGQAELVAQDAFFLQVGPLLLAEEAVGGPQALGVCLAAESARGASPEAEETYASDFSLGLAIRARDASPEAEQAAHPGFALLVEEPLQRDWPPSAEAAGPGRATRSELDPAGALSGGVCARGRAARRCGRSSVRLGGPRLGVAAGLAGGLGSSPG